MKKILVERVYLFPNGTEKCEINMTAEDIVYAENKIRNELIKNLHIKV